ncbi:winged helix-turn-helix domain-containing protein [Burkholderia glumae]|uniref:winged helix-turn-helix domain-containing protein n=1 Tax=Burkholderia glumae TaxID=337 RepID=UPI002151AD65|nr:winged helix-turn-helix domain-containing protein [Burkholderia glumae]
MAANVRRRGEVSKLILEMLKKENLSVNEVAKRLGIACPSAHYHIAKLRVAKKVRVAAYVRLTYRINLSMIFGIGNEPDAMAPPELKSKKLSELMTPAKHELMAALFGPAPTIPLSQYVSHVYQQND